MNAMASYNACRSVHVLAIATAAVRRGGEGRGRRKRGGGRGGGGEERRKGSGDGRVGVGGGQGRHLCDHFRDPVHLVPQLAAGGGEADEGLLQGHAGVVGPLLHDLAQPHHLHLLGLELQLGRHRLLGVQHLLGGEQRQEEGAVACIKAATRWGSDNKQPFLQIP